MIGEARIMTGEDLRTQAVALRREGLSRRQIQERLKLGSNGALGPLLEGEPPPEWTRRPNAKDELRAKARELRKAGRTYDEIVAELGVSKSSVSLWVRDLPKPTRSPEEMRHMREARWEPHRQERDALRRATRKAAMEEIGQLTDRELFLVGVGLYWAEGAKSKSYAPREDVQFVNSDPGVIRVFLAWLRLLEVRPERLRFRVMIHETADVAAAERYWAQEVGIEVSSLAKTTLKKHNAKTTRKNTGETYRGCLVVRVRRGADLYRRIDGWWAGIVGGVGRSSGQ
jgi:transposase